MFDVDVRHGFIFFRLFVFPTFQQVINEPAKCVRLLPAHSYAAVGFNSGLIRVFTFVLASQGFGKVEH